MSTNQYDKGQIFNAAAERKGPGERAAYLAEACGENRQLRAEIEELLQHDEQAGSFLDAPPPGMAQTVDACAIAEGPGTIIDHYKLLQQIGEGGFGVVFMAEQTEPVRRKVALKIIRPGMETKEVIARFQAEAQALALMDHPNIARVFDAGATESGRPYFVMELVRGIPITDYCDQNNLAPRERLELFVHVCQAVQHAHQKGVIHRDIKPSNVLVTLHDGAPVVKMIDFGIAKAINQQLTERTLFTRFDQMLGTPLYMSPEQAEMSGLDVDTRTDIYSLGVLLYELLTGVTPFDKERLREAAYDEVRRIIREEEPPRPSQKISTLGERATAVSAHRKMDPSKLSALVRGDLDWIAMKALEKDRTRRYETATHFAEDVQHYLMDRPVEARAPSTLYRVRKFVRRYRVAAATVAVVAATLIGAAGFSTWMAVSERLARNEAQTQKEEAEGQKQRAEAESQKARGAAAEAEFALDVIGTALGATESNASESPDRTVLEMLDALARRLDASAERNSRVEARVRSIIGKAYFSLGRMESAERQLLAAVESRREVYGEMNAETADTLIWLALACSYGGQPTKAEEYLRRSLAIWSRIEGGEVSIGAARALSNLSVSLLFQGKAQESLDVATKALAVFREHSDATPGDVAWATTHVAESRSALGDTHKAIAGFRDAVAIFRNAGEAEGQYQVWQLLGTEFRRQGALFDAKDAFSLALKLSENLSRQRIDKRHQSAIGLSGILFDLRDWQAAETLHREYLPFAEGHLGRADRRVLEARSLLADALAAQGREGESRSLRSEILSIIRNAREGGQSIWPGILDRIKYAGLLTMTTTDDASLGEALRTLKEVEDDANREPDKSMRCLWHAVSSEIHKRMGRHDEAIRQGRAALEKAPHDDLATENRDQNRLVRLLRDTGQSGEAESVLRKSLADMRDELGNDHVLTNYARTDLAEWLVEFKKYAEAEDLLQHAQKAILADPRVPTLQRQRVADTLAKLYDAWGKPEQASLWRAKLDKVPASEPNKAEMKSSSGK